MTKGAQESWRNVEIPDARAGFYIGGGAAHNALDDSRTGLRADRDVLAEKVEFAQGRPTFHIEVAAKPQWIDRTPNHAFDGGDRGEVDDGNHLLGDVRKAMTRRGQHLREPAQFIGAEPREKSLDGGTAAGGAQIATGGFRALFPEHEHLRSIVKMRIEPCQPLVLHQHEEPLLG